MNNNDCSISWKVFFIRRIYRLFLAVVGVCPILPTSFSQELNAYKTIISGDFPDISIWNVWDGFTWNPALFKPDETNDIYIDQTHTLRLVGNESVKSVFINAETGAAQKLNLNGHNLDIFGTLQAFSGAAPGTPGNAWNSQNWIGNNVNSTLTFKGNSRTLIQKASWSGQTTQSRFSVIFEPDLGEQFVLEAPFKALSFTVRSGQILQKVDTSVLPNVCFTLSFNTETTVFGTGPFGELIIESGATFISECNANILNRSTSGTTSALNFDLQNGGTLILDGANPRIESANFQLNGRVIYRGGTTAKTYLSSSYADATIPNAVRDVELQGTQNLTLPPTLSLLGDLEKSGTGNFIATATSLTLLGGSDQEVLGFPLVVRDLNLNKTGGVFYPNANLTVQRNLTLTQGRMDLGWNDLLINTGLAGSLNFSGGSWRNIGKLTYFGIPFNLNETNSTFPFEDTQNGGIRKVQLLGTSAGGNLSINFTEYKGAEYNSGFTDNDDTEILYRLFSYFQFSDLTPSSNPLELRISAADLIVDNVDDLRIVGTGYAAPGSHLPGEDPVKLWARRDLTFTELLDVNFTIGSYRTLSILPVTWLEKRAKSTSAGNLITWKVANERDNLLYEVYSSVNPTAGEWAKVGVINSMGDTDSPREYQFLDNSAQKFRDTYYRVRQVDFSGRSTWSEVTKVAISKELLPKDQLIIYPNPYFSGNLNLILPDFIDTSEADLILQDSQGKVIFHSKFLVDNLSDLVTNLAPGLYLIRVISEGNELTGRLMRR
ncbi:T9SS type A sorting domain-containing protein [Algoriphagus sp.]|uniref:T9SS type A sorting domain-containing protein n=1 Tax=Algoriphagus sp. TaxID=1872435 RepID=UPI00391B7675